MSEDIKLPMRIPCIANFTEDQGGDLIPRYYKATIVSFTTIEKKIGFDEDDPRTETVPAAITISETGGIEVHGFGDLSAFLTVEAMEERAAELNC
ncbi:hypothetical protein [Gimesia fumaroli]|uniref:Uncharacterized protein n=1 Tax=Gimesia fumaroli TaxID=2527976 RepID=A0A518I9A0_9PLAN|nr:hypothetical protein [Gimesia fumaroli]QDV49572.1 hypothetical protein Enr17x_15920 [Gimesia fumaroli]